MCGLDTPTIHSTWIYQIWQYSTPSCPRLRAGGRQKILANNRNGGPRKSIRLNVTCPPLGSRS